MYAVRLRPDCESKETYGDDTVEYNTVIVATSGEFCKVLACLLVITTWNSVPVTAAISQPRAYARSMVPIQLQLDVPHAGFEYYRLLALHLLNKVVKAVQIPCRSVSGCRLDEG